MGGLGALTTPPNGIASWVREFRDQSNGGFQIHLWIPDPPPVRDPEHERKVRDFLRQWRARSGRSQRRPAARLCAQCEALLAAAPPGVSSIKPTVSVIGFLLGDRGDRNTRRLPGNGVSPDVP
jgi:nitronate monooxygenase